MHPLTRILIPCIGLFFVLFGAAPGAQAATGLTITSDPAAPTTNVSTTTVDGITTFSVEDYGAVLNTAQFNAVPAVSKFHVVVLAGAIRSGNDIEFDSGVSLGGFDLTLSTPTGLGGSVLTPVASAGTGTLASTGSITVMGTLVVRGTVDVDGGITVDGDLHASAVAGDPSNTRLVTTQGNLSFMKLDATGTTLSIDADVVTGRAGGIAAGTNLSITAPGGINFTASGSVTGTNMTLTGPVHVGSAVFNFDLTGSATFTGGALTGDTGSALTSSRANTIHLPSQGTSGFDKITLSNAGGTINLYGPVSAGNVTLVRPLLSAPTSVTGTTGNVTLTNTYGPAMTLTVMSPGTTDINGTSTDIRELRTDAPGRTTIATGVLIRHQVSLRDLLWISAPTTFTHPNTNIELLGGVYTTSSSFGLTITTLGTVRLEGEFGRSGATEQLNSLDVTASMTALGADLHYATAATIIGPSMLVGDSNLGAHMTLWGSLDGAFAVTGGTLRSRADVGATMPPASVATTGTWYLRADATVTGDVTANSVYVYGDRTLTSRAGSIVATIGADGVSTPSIVGAARISMPTGHGLRLVAPTVATATGALTPDTLFVDGATVRVPVGTSIGSTQLDSGTVSGAGTAGAIVGSSVTSMLDPATPAGGVATLATGALSGKWSYTPQLNGTSVDQVAVTGSVAIDGKLGLLETTPLAASTAHTIIDNDGTDAVTGTFEGLAEGAAITLASGNVYRISYVGGTGNDVTITRDAPPVKPTPPVPPAPPVVDPTPPVTPARRVAPLRMVIGDRCLVAGRSNPRISYRLSRRARVTYSIQRSVRPPARVSTRRACTNRQTPAANGTGTSRYVVTHSTSRMRAAGHVRTTLRAMLGGQQLRPGVYRIVITARVPGTRARTTRMSIVVVNRA